MWWEKWLNFADLLPFYVFFSLSEKKGHAVPVNAFCPAVHQGGFLSQAFIKSIHLCNLRKQMIPSAWRSFQYHDHGLCRIDCVSTECNHSWGLRPVYMKFCTELGPFVVYVRKLDFLEIKREIIWSWRKEQHSGLWTVTHQSIWCHFQLISMVDRKNIWIWEELGRLARSGGVWTLRFILLHTNRQGLGMRFGEFAF